ncbi:MAG TPA: glutathione S-transferase C-terminal domain-containing protein [Streptosporangiaceae bacterium]|nr:glutathione S-transferase C-terminal domain-containing protein [Streptosporangiaceae bacterium]
MTATSERAAGGASPVDFDTYGDYGSFKKAEDSKKAEEKPDAFVRAPYPFRGRISADGEFPAESGRYHLYISWACPWAQRTAIVRRLLGLEDVISMTVVDPIRDGRGWAFRNGPGHSLDEVNGFSFLREAYEATEPGYPGHISVPVLWDKATSKIVSNNFPDITIDLDTAFGRWADPRMELYPEGLRAEIDEVNELVYATVNNGVYRCGFAPSQQAYHAAVTDLFGTLDLLDARLADRRYLMGARVTEADVRLWVTLARFDSVYYSHFKTSIRRLTEYHNLWGYARDLYSLPAFSGTTNFDHIKRHYFMTHSHLNPLRIVPEGPVLDWHRPHGREKL